MRTNRESRKIICCCCFNSMLNSLSRFFPFKRIALSFTLCARIMIMQLNVKLNSKHTHHPWHFKSHQLLIRMIFFISKMNALKILTMTQNRLTRTHTYKRCSSSLNCNMQRNSEKFKFATSNTVRIKHDTGFPYI